MDAHVSRRTMALWTKNEFHLTTMPGKSTISRVLSLDQSLSAAAVMVELLKRPEIEPENIML